MVNVGYLIIENGRKFKQNGIDRFNQTVQDLRHQVRLPNKIAQAKGKWGYKESPRGIDKWALMSEEWWRCTIESTGLPG